MTLDACALSYSGRQRRLFHGCHRGTAFEIEVTRIDTSPGSHLVIVIRGSPGDLQPRVVEYVTDDVTLEAALGTAQQIAREFIDRQWA
jgi:hypothetical protein